jgi:group II intron reverse transcriptase/maturase
VFEPLFCDEMMGFRPNRGCHGAIRKLNDMIEHHKTNYILDADIRGFFDHLDHEWIIKMIETHIKDPNIIRLTRKMLKSGVMIGFNYEDTDEGSGQGAVCSPVIANIYMHFTVMYWFKKRQGILKGYSGIVVYADDFVICYQYEGEARKALDNLRIWLSKVGLELAESKTRLIEFGRFAEIDRQRRGEGKPDTFTFLGFTHYCSTSKNGKFRVKRKTSRKKFARKCKELSDKISKMRTWKLKDIFFRINQILVGYYHYYGITDNFFWLDVMRERVIGMLFYWLNRRSQRRSYTWKGFRQLLKYYPIAKPKIYVNIYG